MSEEEKDNPLTESEKTVKDPKNADGANESTDAKSAASAGPERVGDADVQAAADKKAKNASRMFSRRQLIGGVVASLAVGALGGVGGSYAYGQSQKDDTSIGGPNYNMIDLTLTCPLYDQDHPVGIKDPANQRYCAFAKFNMAKNTTAEDLQWLLATWTAQAATMMKGDPVGPIRPTLAADSVGEDSGDVSELYPANLSVTFGFGAPLFDDRFGISKFKPDGLTSYERIVGDEFDAKADDVQSDLCIQVRADDPSVVYHCVRQLARAAGHRAHMTFTDQGYMPYRQTDQHTPRDQFGFRDGTTNPTEDEEFDKDVWVSNSGQPWFDGGSYLVYRNDGVDIEAWDNDRISDQELSIGRRKDTGAPLSKPDGEEMDVPDLNAKDENGNYMIDPASHVAITSDQRLGFKILRSSYNYWNGLKDSGFQNAGFLNIAFTNSLDKFKKLRNDMGKYDLMNEYYYGLNGAYYAVPQAPKTGSYVGKEFFA